MLEPVNTYTGRERWIDGYGGAREKRCQISVGRIYRCTLCGLYLWNPEMIAMHKPIHKERLK